MKESENKRFNLETDLKKLENYLRREYLENKNMTSWLPERLHDLIYRMDTQYTDEGNPKSSDYIFIWEDNEEIVGCILPEEQMILDHTNEKPVLPEEFEFLPVKSSLWIYYLKQIQVKI